MNRAHALLFVAIVACAGESDVARESVAISGGGIGFGPSRRASRPIPGVALLVLLTLGLVLVRPRRASLVQPMR